jgi:DNA-3-methyladenine glycosylase
MMGDRQFFAQDAVVVAQQLLGKVIEYNGCRGMIVETEAYTTDKASHAYRRTPRSEIMYSTSGYWYVYFIYGMYYCLNITTNGDKPGAVLIRAVEPRDGITLMRQRRECEDAFNLTSGPGKVCQAFGITQSLNGTPVGLHASLKDHQSIKKSEIAATSRIGIAKDTYLLWRFYVKNNPYVSK